jgi:transcriptional regulator with XRE-family HTH domain
MKRIETRPHAEQLARLIEVRTAAIEHTKIARSLARERRLIIEELLAEGFNQSDLARELGVTRQAIQKMVAVGQSGSPRSESLRAPATTARLDHRVYDRSSSGDGSRVRDDIRDGEEQCRQHGRQSLSITFAKGGRWGSMIVVWSSRTA